MFTQLPAEASVYLCSFARIFGFFLPFAELRRHLGVLNIGGFAVVLAAGLTRSIPLAALPPSFEAKQAVVQSVIEIAFGMLIGAPFAFILSFVLSGARLVDFFRGNQLAEQLLPGYQERTSTLEAPFTVGALAIVFSTGTWIQPLEIVRASLVSAPQAAMEFSAHSFGQMIAIVHTSFAETVRFLGPLVATLFAYDLFTIGIARAYPRAPLQSELAAMRLLLGLAVLGVLNWESFGAESLLTAAETAARSLFGGVRG